MDSPYQCSAERIQRLEYLIADSRRTMQTTRDVNRYAAARQYLEKFEYELTWINAAMAKAKPA
jgi:hypothetical protein